MGRTWTMPRRGKYALALGVAALTATAAIAGTGSAGAAGSPTTVAAKGKNFTAKPLAATAIRKGTKDGATDAVRTDPSLLGQRGTNLVAVVVKLKYASVASYRGNLKGLRATSPRVTGRKINRRSAAVRAYSRYIARRETSFRSALAASVPNAKVGRALRQVYGGVALTRAGQPGRHVLACPASPPSSPTSCSTADRRQSVVHRRPDDLPTRAARRNAGKGIIFGDIDTGMWPEHPSFADHRQPRRPAGKADGTPRRLRLRRQPADAGGRPVRLQQQAHRRPAVPRHLQRRRSAMSPTPTRARDSDGPRHAHDHAPPPATRSSDARSSAIDRGPLAGIAPGAWVIVVQGLRRRRAASPSDSAAAVAAGHPRRRQRDQLLDRRRRPTATPIPVELAFLDAYDAGVFVAASAGNSGPGASTTEHRGPWVTTVAALDPDRVRSSRR